MTTCCIVMTSLQYPSAHRRADYKELIMLLDVELYQDPRWHPAFLSFSTFCRVPLAVLGSVLRGPVRARPGAMPVDSSLALLSQQEDISWSNRERLRTKAVWSAQRMELEKIRLHPAGHCVPRAGPEPVGPGIVKGKGQVQRPG